MVETQNKFFPCQLVKSEECWYGWRSYSNLEVIGVDCDGQGAVGPFVFISFSHTDGQEFHNAALRSVQTAELASGDDQTLLAGPAAEHG